MPVRGFSDFIRDIPKKSVWLLDTNFIIASAGYDETPEVALRKRLTSQECRLVYNSVVRSELLHYLRTDLMIDGLKKELTNLTPDCARFLSEIKTEIADLEKANRTPNYIPILKRISARGYAGLFRKILGEKGEFLNQAFDAVTAHCRYAAPADLVTNLNQAVHWSALPAIMALYGHDSSDGMIMNFAASFDIFDGIITMDHDYKYCGDMSHLRPGAKPFTIVTTDRIAKSAINRCFLSDPLESSANQDQVK